MRCRVRGRQVHRVSTIGERDGHGCGNRGLADAALAHEQHDAVAPCLDLVDEIRKWAFDPISPWDVLIPVLVGCEKPPKRGQPHDVGGLELDDVDRQIAEGFRQCIEDGLLALTDRAPEGFARPALEAGR